VAQVVYSARSIADLERAFAWLFDRDPDAVEAAASAITTAIDLLASHPLIGRRVGRRLRELVISYGRTGYVALYRFVAAQDEIRVLAIRHQRELDYPT
jgi:plasmid stabilization system protein ParE